MIRLIKQKPSGCVFACLAMAAGKTLTEIEELYTSFFGEYDLEGVPLNRELVLLDALQQPYQSISTNTIYLNRVYLVTVPSLQSTLASHRILIDYGFFENKITIYDPIDASEKYEDMPAVMRGCWDITEICYPLAFHHEFKRMREKLQ